jgi:hypothetical protein
MHAPREPHSAERRPRLTVVRSELRALQRSREGGGRLPAHPLEFDERGLPIAQPPPTAATLLGRFMTR